MVEYINCPLCDMDDNRHWASENGWDAVKCNNCGFVYVNPRPDNSEIDQAAKTGLHKTEKGILNATGTFSERSFQNFQKRLLELFSRDELTKDNLRWLDVGCGFGELLLALKSMTSQSAVLEGVEPSEPKRLVANKNGLSVSGKNFCDITQKYDVISLINVFSHLPNPREFLTDISQLLDTRGLLIILTGNGGDIKPEDYPKPYSFPDHLAFAGENNLDHLLESTGLRILKKKKYRDFYYENKFSAFKREMKNMIKYCLGIPRDLGRKGPFREIFIKAQIEYKSNNM